MVFIVYNATNNQYQLTDMQIDHKKQITLQNNPSQQQCSDLDIFEMLSSVLVTIAKSQQILQCMREILVTDPTFSPMTLFKYLTNGNPQLSRKNIISFLDENNLVKDDKQTDDLLKRILNRYSIASNNGIAYTSYLNFIFPYNSGVLRDLLTNRIKKYPEIDRAGKGFRPSDSVITSFLLLVEEEIKVEKRIEVQVNDQRFPGRERLKKIIKSIKRASEKTTPSVIEKSQNTISMLQIRNFIKAFMDVDDHLFLDLGRRLGLNKSGQIPLQNLETMLKKIKKPIIQTPVQSTDPLKQNCDKNSPKKNCTRGESRQAKQKSFKEQLYRELASTLNATQNQSTRNKTPRAKSANRSTNQQNHIYENKNKTPKKRNVIQNSDLSALENSNQAFENSGLDINENLLQSVPYRVSSNLQRNRIGKDPLIASRLPPNQVVQKKQTVQQSVAKTLFKQFVQIFLKGHKQIQKCKAKLASLSNIDYLSLFKTLDNGRGVIDAEAMQKFYTRLSGIPTDYNFQLLIERYAQPQQKWLSYSQFSEIFKCPTSRTDQNPQPTPSSYHEINGIRLHPESIRLLAQIIYLTLDLEHLIKKVLKKFKKSDIQSLFSKINVDSESKGFINYQELKKYLVEELQINIPMIDLMALLKRLDKSKNGVVVKEEFLIS